MHHKCFVLYMQTLADKAGNQFYCVASHYTQIIKMINEKANYTSAPLIVIWAENECMVKHLRMRVAMWVVWHGGGLFYSIHCVWVFHDLIIETSALIMCGNTIYRNHLSTKIFVMVSPFWLGVMNAWLNLVKVSVRTRMSSLPSLEGSTFIKFMHNRSSGLLAIIDPSFVFEFV